MEFFWGESGLVFVQNATLRGKVKEQAQFGRIKGTFQSVSRLASAARIPPPGAICDNLSLDLLHIRIQMYLIVYVRHSREGVAAGGTLFPSHIRQLYSQRHN